MALTAIPNNPAITLQPTAPTSQPSPSLNPQFLACDPTNGNYFVTTNRDLATFVCLPSSSAPAWSSAASYTLGQVVNVTTGSPPVQTAYIALGASVNQNPTSSPTYWATYTSSTLNLSSAPDACTGRTANVVGYPVPVFNATQQTVEFLVLPSSVFTQASGQFQFTASSNLVYVYVRNL